jgi:hypothetical protein
MPPKAKIYEALSAVADGRVVLAGQTTAHVQSSSRNKTYLVEWSQDICEITSNDNASYWQGYMGYPLIAVLLKIGKLSYHPDIAGQLAGVPWKDINDKFKRDYDRAVDFVLDHIEAKGVKRTEMTSEADKIYRQLSSLELKHLQRRRQPPKKRQN